MLGCKAILKVCCRVRETTDLFNEVIDVDDLVGEILHHIELKDVEQVAKLFSVDMIMHARVVSSATPDQGS